MRCVKKKERPPIESLTCVNEACQMYGQRGQGNLRVRKVYGQDKLRYLRCGVCQAEFSERKGTALWNSKVPEAKAVAIAVQLSEGTSYKGTARLTRRRTLCLALAGFRRDRGDGQSGETNLFKD